MEPTSASLPSHAKSSLQASDRQAHQNLTQKEVGRHGAHSELEDDAVDPAGDLAVTFADGAKVLTEDELTDRIASEESSEDDEVERDRSIRAVGLDALDEGCHVVEEL